MQIKTTLGFHLTPVEMVKINKTTDSSCWYGCDGRRTLILCWGTANFYSHCRNLGGHFSERWELISLKIQYVTLNHILKGSIILPQRHLLNFGH